ncbi:MAG: HAMP domain-containing protein [Bdellovibrionia bacterium]
MSEQPETKRRRQIRSYLISPRYQLKCVALTAGTGILMVIATVAIFVVFIREHFLIWINMVPMSSELELRLYSELRQVVLTMVFFSILWIAMLCLFSIILSHRTAGPLYRFRRIFDEIRSGNHNRRIRLRPGDDFHEVAHSFNEMMESLLEKQGENDSK